MNWFAFICEYDILIVVIINKKKNMNNKKEETKNKEENIDEKENRIPVIGEKAPSFEAKTTQGKISFPDDFEGNWVILFSHPADFTPVCSSEFMTFASMEKKFEDLNAKLVGLSVDGIHSHIAWLRTIKEKLVHNGIEGADVKFPLIEDISMDVAKKYGMIQPEESKTEAVRAVFFIDPDGIIRTLLYYPLSLGRSFDELYRILIGLQTADEFGVATPADWQPGDDVIVPPAGTSEEAEERMNDDSITCDDWFFCKKNISKKEIEKKIKN